MVNNTPDHKHLIAQYLLSICITDPHPPVPRPGSRKHPSSSSSTNPTGLDRVTAGPLGKLLAKIWGSGA